MFERLDPPDPFRPDERFRAAVTTRGRRIRRRRHRLVAGGLSSVLVLVAGAGIAVGWANGRWDDVQRVEIAQIPPRTKAQEREPFNVLVVGVDGPRPDAPQVIGERTDTIAVVRFDPQAGKASVLSIPRDLWVELAATGEHGRINEAFEGSAGPARLVATVESALGIPVDHYLEVDLDGFTHLVDAVGGVRLDFPAPMRSLKTGLSVRTPGCVTFDGHQALAFVRGRSEVLWQVDGWRLDLTGDLGRIRRQQQFAVAVLATFKGIGRNPIERARVLDAFADWVTMDDRWTREELERLAGDAADLAPADVWSATVPVTDAVKGAAQVLVLAPGADAVLAPFRGGPAPSTPPTVPGGPTATEPTSPAVTPC